MPVYDFSGTTYPEIKPIWDVDTAIHETGKIWEGSGGVNNLVYTASVPITVIGESSLAGGSLGIHAGYDNGWSDYSPRWLTFNTVAGHTYYCRLYAFEYRTSKGSEYGQVNTLYYNQGGSVDYSGRSWLQENWPQYNGIGIPLPSTEAGYARYHYLFGATTNQMTLSIRHRGRCDVGASSFFSGKIVMLCDVTALNATSAADAWAKLGYTEFTGTKEVNG